jgi:hypothetical protein
VRRMAVDVVLRDGTTQRWPDGPDGTGHSWRMGGAGELQVLADAQRPPVPVATYPAGTWVSVGGDPAEEQDE